MPGNDEEKPGTTAPEQVPATTVGPETKPVTPSEQARLEQAKLKGQIASDWASRTERQKFLKDECAKRRTPEGWTENNPNPDWSASMAKSLIGDTVEEKFAKYQPQFEANGLGDSANVSTIKQAAKDIVFDHFIKTGNNQDKTKSYAENELEGKMLFLFNELQRIFTSKVFPFEKPADCLASFSEFTGLNFFKNGSLNLAELKTALLLQQTDYKFFLMNFEQYLKIGTVAPESGPETTPTPVTATPGTSATPETPPSPAPAPTPGTPPAPESAQTATPSAPLLKSPARILIAPSEILSTAAIRKAIYEQLPADTDPRTRDATADRLVDTAKKLDAEPGETIEIGTDGTVQKINIAGENSETSNPQPEAQNLATDTQTPDSGTQPPASLPEKSEAEKTGFEKFFEKVSKFFEKIMGYITAFLAKMGLGEGPEFANLNDSDKKEAQDFKKAAETAGLNLETLHLLFMDAEQTRKILKEKKDKNLSWEDYLKKYLTTEESDELKKKQELKADKLAEMFTTPATPQTPEYTPVTAQGTPQAQTTNPPAPGA